MHSNPEPMQLQSGSIGGGGGKYNVQTNQPGNRDISIGNRGQTKRNYYNHNQYLSKPTPRYPPLRDGNKRRALQLAVIHFVMAQRICQDSGLKTKNYVKEGSYQLREQPGTYNIVFGHEKEVLKF